MSEKLYKIIDGSYNVCIKNGVIGSSIEDLVCDKHGIDYKHSKFRILCEGSFPAKTSTAFLHIRKKSFVNDVMLQDVETGDIVFSNKKFIREFENFYKVAWSVEEDGHHLSLQDDAGSWQWSVLTVNKKGIKLHGDIDENDPRVPFELDSNGRIKLL